jgi:hypothetical protein
LADVQDTVEQPEAALRLDAESQPHVHGPRRAFRSRLVLDEPSRLAAQELEPAEGNRGRVIHEAAS